MIGNGKEGGKSGLAAVSTRKTGQGLPWRRSLQRFTRAFETTSPVAGADTHVHLVERTRNNGSVREVARGCKMFFYPRSKAACPPRTP